MRELSPRICRESWESQRDSGRYNPASVALWRSKYGKHRWVLPCGTSDDISFFREGDLVYLVCINSRLDYVGVSVFSCKDNDELGEVFCQSEEHWRDALGPRGLDLHPRNIAKRLAEYAILY
jgi:hypothetical protein